MTLSRREFLQISGVLLAGAQWLPSFGAQAASFERPLQGRALAPLTITRADGATVRTLLPDSILPILGTNRDTYATAGGMVPRALVQPMSVAPSSADRGALPFLAEVSAPVAAIHASCAADAPLVGRIGHAGTATVLSRLSDGHGGADWYEVQAGGLTGWSQSTLWSPVESLTPTARARTVVIDRAAQTLTALDEQNHVMLQALVSVAPDASAGRYAVNGRQPSGLATDGSGVQHGAPWQLQLAGGMLGGATWHNRFGAAMPGMLVQAPPQVAKWLYTWLGDGSTVVIQ